MSPPTPPLPFLLSFSCFFLFYHHGWCHIHSIIKWPYFTFFPWLALFLGTSPPLLVPNQAECFLGIFLGSSSWDLLCPDFDVFAISGIITCFDVACSWVIFKTSGQSFRLFLCLWFFKGNCKSNVGLELTTLKPRVTYPTNRASQVPHGNPTSLKISVNAFLCRSEIIVR